MKNQVSEISYDLKDLRKRPSGELKSMSDYLETLIQGSKYPAMKDRYRKNLQNIRIVQIENRQIK